jgi:putative membrane protein
VHFWLTFLHITSLSVWFTGLFLLPRLIMARGSAPDRPGHRQFVATGRTLYLGVATPAGVLTVMFGTALLFQGFEGAWLPAKLGLVVLAVLLHMYLGHLLYTVGRGHAQPGRLVLALLSGAPMLLLLAIAALAAGKPAVLPLPGVG